MKIEARNLVKHYGSKVAVKDISLTIQPGKILGLLGPNGAGKSTMIKMLTGQIKPTDGSIIVDGEEYSHLPETVRHNIGIMPQEIIIWDDLNILENLQISANLHNLSKEKSKSRVKFLIEALKLQPELKTLARDLSGGYKRRVNLAISIIHDPKVIFLDEPTPGIDAQSRLLLNTFIQDLADTGNYSIVLTDHYLDEAEKLCDYIIIIDNGEIVTEGKLSQLKKEHGQGKFLEIELDDSSKKSKEIKKLLLTAFPDGKFVKSNFACLAPDLVKSLELAVKTISQKGLSINNISIKEPSLEDIFLLITGKDVRE